MVYSTVEIDVAWSDGGYILLPDLGNTNVLLQSSQHTESLQRTIRICVYGSTI